MNNWVLNCVGLSKTYSEGPQSLDILQDINLQLSAGEKIAIVGSSGAGKTTLLNLLCGIDLPSTGYIEVAGQRLNELNETQRGRLRNQNIGLVFQFHHLLGEFSALENVAMPLLIANMSTQQAQSKAREVLVNVGLEQRLQHKPGELSGGERQRVAIARALVNQPKCVFMDEPTGNLDEETAAGIHQLMGELSAQYGISFVVVTHNRNLAMAMDKTYRLERGELNLQA